MELNVQGRHTIQVLTRLCEDLKDVIDSTHATGGDGCSGNLKYRDETNNQAVRGRIKRHVIISGATCESSRHREKFQTSPKPSQQL